MIDKTALRNTIKAKRQALSPQQIQVCGMRFMSQIQHFFADLPPQKIAVYLADKGELDLSAAIDWLWRQGHFLYLPVIRQDRLLFSEYTENTPLIPNCYGIPEPEFPHWIAATGLDYVLAPLVAFDRQGHRLGMGKGYYDRSFAFRKSQSEPVLIGCAYAFQQVDALRVEDHDIPMDFILAV